MPRMVSNNLRRRIGRLQLGRVQADLGASVPSKTLLDFLTKLQDVSKEQLVDFMAWRNEVGISGDG